MSNLWPFAHFFGPTKCYTSYNSQLRIAIHQIIALILCLYLILPLGSSQSESTFSSRINKTNPYSSILHHMTSSTSLCRNDGIHSCKLASPPEVESDQEETTTLSFLPKQQQDSVIGQILPDKDFQYGTFALKQPQKLDDLIEINVESTKELDGPVYAVIEMETLDPCASSLANHPISERRRGLMLQPVDDQSGSFRYSLSQSTTTSWGIFLSKVTRCALSKVVVSLYSKYDIEENNINNTGPIIGDILAQTTYTGDIILKSGLTVFLPPPLLIHSAFFLANLSEYVVNRAPFSFNDPVPPKTYFYAAEPHFPLFCIGIFGSQVMNGQFEIQLNHPELGGPCLISTLFALYPIIENNSNLNFHITFIDIPYFCQTVLPPAWLTDFPKKTDNWSFQIHIKIPREHPYYEFIPGIYSATGDLLDAPPAINSLNSALFESKTLLKPSIRTMNHIINFDSTSSLVYPPVNLPIVGTSIDLILEIESTFKPNVHPGTASDSNILIACQLTAMASYKDYQRERQYYPSIVGNTSKINDNKLSWYNIPIQDTVLSPFLNPYDETASDGLPQGLSLELMLCVGSYEYPIFYFPDSRPLSMLFSTPNSFLNSISVHIHNDAGRTADYIDLYTTFFDKPSNTISFYLSASYTLKNDSAQTTFKLAGIQYPDVQRKPIQKPSFVTDATVSPIRMQDLYKRYTFPLSRSKILALIPIEYRNQVDNIFDISIMVVVDDSLSEIRLQSQIDHTHSYCAVGWTGFRCQQNLECQDIYAYHRYCHGHGNVTIDSKTGNCRPICECEVGWIGVNCSQEAVCLEEYDALDQCSHRGFVQHNAASNSLSACSAECTCLYGWTGPTCQRPLHCESLFSSQVFNRCSGRGTILTDQYGRCQDHCTCDSGWTGKACELTASCKLAITSLFFASNDNTSQPEHKYSFDRICSENTSLFVNTPLGSSYCLAGCGCRDQTNDGNLQLQDLTCSGHGIAPVSWDPLTGTTCSSDSCYCDSGWYGRQCQHKINCPETLKGLEYCSFRGYIDAMTSQQCQKQTRCICDDPDLWTGATCRQPKACESVSQRYKCGQYGIVRAIPSETGEPSCDGACSCLFGYQGPFCEQCSIKCYRGSLNPRSFCQNNLNDTSPCLCQRNSSGLHCQYASYTVQITFRQRLIPIWLISTIEQLSTASTPNNTPIAPQAAEFQNKLGLMFQKLLGYSSPTLFNDKNSNDPAIYKKDEVLRVETSLLHMKVGRSRCNKVITSGGAEVSTLAHLTSQQADFIYRDSEPDNHGIDQYIGIDGDDNVVIHTSPTGHWPTTVKFDDTDPFESLQEVTSDGIYIPSILSFLVTTKVGQSLETLSKELADLQSKWIYLLNNQDLVANLSLLLDEELIYRIQYDAESAACVVQDKGQQEESETETDGEEEVPSSNWSVNIRGYCISTIFWIIVICTW